MLYHLFYSEAELKSEAVLRVRKFISEQHFFKKEDSEKLEMLKVLCCDLCRIYEIADIKDISIMKNYYGVGGYNPFAKNIIINKCSLVTFLHEFKHHLNNCLHTDNSEDTARGYSHSLYFLATPKLFESAVNRGLLIFQNSMTELTPIPREAEAEATTQHIEAEERENRRIEEVFRGRIYEEEAEEIYEYEEEERESEAELRAKLEAVREREADIEAELEADIEFSN